MTDKPKDATADMHARRAFLKGLLMSTGGAAALAGAAVAPMSGRAASEQEPSSDQAGYRETDHVRTYYATARL